MTRTDKQPRERLADAVQELTEPHTHHEPFTIRKNDGWLTARHKTRVLSLIDQLGQALEPGGTADFGHAIPSSRPTARLEAIDTLLTIDLEVNQWVDHLGLHIRTSLTANLRALVGAHVYDDEQLLKLAACASRWVTLAKVTTGWEVPPFRPDNTCPLCGVRGGLRIRVGDGVGSQEVSAVCVECRETWDTANITLLGDHIKAENGELEQAS